jgi:hypothetical protein
MEPFEAKARVLDAIISGSSSHSRYEDAPKEGV